MVRGGMVEGRFWEQRCIYRARCFSGTAVAGQQHQKDRTWNRDWDCLVKLATEKRWAKDREDTTRFRTEGKTSRR